MFDLVLARHHQRTRFHIRRRLLLPDLRNGFRTALMEIRFNESLGESVTRTLSISARVPSKIHLQIGGGPYNLQA